MFDIHQKIFDSDGEMDEALAGSYREELFEAFAASPEALSVIEKCGRLAWTDLMMEYSFNYLGATPATMTRSDFEEVLFDLIPRKVSTSPDKAEQIVAELRAFWGFVQREYNLANAKKVLAVLDYRAAGRLQRELANPAKFGMAKSFVMLGLEAGYDMTTAEGMAEFTAVYNASLGGMPVGQLPSPDEVLPIEASWDEPLPPSPLTNAERKKKRQQRKAQRQARKRNRK